MNPIPALAQLTDDMARETIRLALAAAAGNVGRAAEALQMSRPTLDRRITALGLREWLRTKYPREKLTPEARAAIRASKEPGAELARRHGVTEAVITRLRRKA